MRAIYDGMFRGLAIAFIVAVLPGWATMNCRSSKAAPQDGVASRISTKAATPTPGMTPAPYGIHSVTGLGTLQSKDII